MEQCNFTLKGKTYSTEPLTVGRMVDLWKLRTNLSMGAYGQMFRYALNGSDAALTAIDVEAFFNVFVPKLIDDLKPSYISDMLIEDYMELEEVYTTQIKPWLSKVEDLMKKKHDG